MCDEGEAAPGPLRIRVTCRQDPATGAKVVDIDPPHAAGLVWDAAWLRLQPGDTATFALVASKD